MSGATPREQEPRVRSLSGGTLRALIVLTVLLGVGLTAYRALRRQSPVSLEQVSRNNLVLQSGRWMKTGETNVFTGVMVEFYPDGTLQSRSVVSNGLLNGVSEGWRTNGVLAVREMFNAGRSHGVRTKWDESGNRIAETDIRAGEIEGMHREWHTNGQPALEVTMVSGKPHGLSRKWNPDGLLVGQWSLSNGVVLTTVTNSAELRSLAQKVGVQ
jgi:antitoxin component YwqK of YwqJK toxin-antitoxin module